MEHPDRPVVIEGHTDSTGSSDYNLQLSESRAAAVERVLLQNGIPPEQIRVRGFGESAPVTSNETAAGRQQNRRVEIVIANPPAVGAR
jgi:outer membrane protein OmpA-like peptidoglycan-associated protein